MHVPLYFMYICSSVSQTIWTHMSLNKEKTHQCVRHILWYDKGISMTLIFQSGVEKKYETLMSTWRNKSCPKNQSQTMIMVRYISGGNTTISLHTSEMSVKS